MQVVRIDGCDDPLVDDYRKVSDAELLRRRNLFVAEGRLLVRRLLETRQHIVSLLLNEVSFRALEPWLADISDQTPIFICNAAGFASITGFDLHRGCLALAVRPAPLAPPAIIEQCDLLLVLEGIADADNVGGAFRNAAAFGVGGVLLSPTCCDPLYRKAVRTSMGSVLRVPYARLESWPEDLAMLKEKHFSLIALTPRNSATDLVRCEKRPRIAVLVGSEGPGLTAAAEAMADVRVRIPIRPAIDSLNLATATGIALHYFTNPDPGRGVIP